MKIFKYSILLFLFFCFGSAYSQLELVPVSNPVYDFLKKMQLENVIPSYNSSMIPISRGEVASYLKKINEYKGISSTDKKILEDLKIEFEFDLNKTLNKSTSVSDGLTGESLFGNNKQKYIYKYSDENSSFFLDFKGSLNNRNLNDTVGNHSLLLGDIGFGLRGNLYDKVGFSVSFTAGQKLSGKSTDLQFAIDNDPILKSNPKFTDGNHYYDNFNGHFRYQTKDNWLALTLGRETLLEGYGYLDKMFLSSNTAPMDFLKIDLNYKKLKYTFSYASIKGDSLGADLKSKNIAFHRLHLQISDYFRLGYYETVIISNNPFSFVYFNPISFITSADLNTGGKETTKNNTLMGFDFEVMPIKDLSLQGTLLIDDINFSTITKNDYTSNENKFGYQVGSIWTRAFTIPDLTLTLEYTRLNPFVYSHRSNKDTYTSWDISLGHALPPNSDEIAIKLNYNFTHRLKLNLLYQFQRSAGGIYYDSVNQHIINYGGNINRGDGDYIINNTFLLGDRINRNTLSMSMTIEPIKQYYLEFYYRYRYDNIIYLSKKASDSYFQAILRLSI